MFATKSTYTAAPAPAMMMNTMNSSKQLRYRNDPYSPQGCVLVLPKAGGMSGTPSLLGDSQSEYAYAPSSASTRPRSPGSEGSFGSSNSPQSKSLNVASASLEDTGAASFPTPCFHQPQQPQHSHLERIPISALNSHPATHPAGKKLKANGDWVELCFGQLPFHLASDRLEALVAYCVPQAKILRVVFQKRDGHRSGLCFVALRDNGAAQMLIDAVNKQITFDVNCTALWARNDAAREELKALSAWRRDNMDPTRKGDGLPLSSMTCEWSRNPQNRRRAKLSLEQ